MLRPTQSVLPLMAALIAIPAIPVNAREWGGWAVITLDDLPNEVTVAQPVTLTYVVRQHGRTLVSGLRGQVEAESRGERVTAAAEAAGEGRYRATLTLPRPGSWTFTVRSGFGNSNVTLMPIPAVNPGRAVPALAEAERGRRLFVAKGCMTCHAHDAVPASGSIDVGPALSGRRYPAEYLSRFLADPAAVGPRASRGAEMPNLNLRATEIAALTAFINGDKGMTAGE